MSGFQTIQNAFGVDNVADAPGMAYHVTVGGAVVTVRFRNGTAELSRRAWGTTVDVVVGRTGTESERATCIVDGIRYLAALG